MLGDHSLLQWKELEQRLKQQAFPLKRDHYATRPQEYFHRLRENSLHHWKLTNVVPDERYAFATSLGHITITANHFDVDPLADLYTEEVRVASHVKNWLSPANVWKKYSKGQLPQSEILNRAVELAAARNRCHVPVTDVTSFYLREALFTLTRECTQFKATLAKAILIISSQILNLNVSELEVLDPCTGWGDRLAAALALGVKRYVGIDPNPLLREGHDAMVHDLAYQTLCCFHNEAFEDVSLKDEAKFDLVFTSPPFAGFERYFTGAEKNSLQSSSRYRDEVWTEYWLLPAVSKMARLLRPGGLLALYVSDTKVGSHCQRLLQFLQNPRHCLSFHGTVWCCRLDRARPLWLWQRWDCENQSIPLSLTLPEDETEVS